MPAPPLSYHPRSVNERAHLGRCRSPARGPLLTLIILAGSCAHGNDLLVTAQDNFGERDYEHALKRYRKLGSEECAPEGNHRLCCAGLLGEAESLLALQEQQAALATFQRCRQECPTDLEVRRRMYLAEHASDPDADPATVPATFTVEHVLGGLADEEKLSWVGLFLDGELVGHEPLSVHPGAHDLEAEVLLEAQGPDKGGSRPVRLRARQPIAVPGPAYIRLTLADRADASLAEDRLNLDMEVKSASDVVPTAPRPPTADVAAKLTIDLRVSGHEPRFPPELARHGDGWKMHAEICVGPEGRVRSIKFPDAAPAHDPRVDAIILETVRRWRYGAYKVDNVLTGFCHEHAFNLAQ
jgi:hypothetical protein